MPTMEDKLDKIVRVVTRTELHVEGLSKADLPIRITKLEQAHKFWKALLIAVPSFGALIVGILKLMS